jgi:hypothetical protein
MAVYGPGWHPQNNIWTEAKLRSKYYFVGDRPVHKLPFGPKHHELFVILYSILANLSDDMFFVIVYLRQKKTSSDKIRKKTLYWSGPVNIIQIQPFYEVDTSLYRPKRCILTEDVFRGRYTSLGRYTTCIDFIERLYFLYY